MKKLALFVICFLFLLQSSNAASFVFSENNKFGLKDEKGNVVAKAKYKKLVRLGEQAWIMQQGTKFGILHDDGKVLVEPQFNQAERVLGKYVKFRKGSRYGIYDELGFEILPVEYSSIDLLYGGMFVTAKNYKFGLTDMNGFVILDNIFDDIYMPDFDTLVIVYNEKQMEYKRDENSIGKIPFSIVNFNADADNSGVNITDIASSPIASTGYYGVTFTDYALKLFSSISPAYEETIDELMFSQGADTVSVLMRCSWIPKFPFVYTKNYYNTVVDPYNGPLSQLKKGLKRKIKN